MKWFLAAIVLAMAGLSAIPKPKPSTLSVQEQRWNTAVVRVEKQSEVRWTTRKIERSKDRYQALEKSTNVPWYVIAALHNMECSLRFDQHLHNGDSLMRRTWEVPKGRPPGGKPPFSFEYSAIDALQYDHMDKVNWKDLTASLDALENYNGSGYRKHGIPSPYLWGGTTWERPGKYVRDGVWSSTAVTSQIGVCALFKELKVGW